MPLNIWNVAGGGNATPQATGLDHDGNLVDMRRIFHKTSHYKHIAKDINESHRLECEPYMYTKRDWGHDANPVRVYRGSRIYGLDNTGASENTDHSIQDSGPLIVY